MKRQGLTLVAVFAALLLGACRSQNPAPTLATTPTAFPPPPDLAPTATLSAYPLPPATPTTNPYPFPLPTETIEILPTSWPFPLTAADNGGTFTYCVTCRFVVFLDPEKYPYEDTVCTPEGIIGWVSNASGLTDEVTGFMSVGFEGFKRGECTLHNGDFSVTIKIIDYS